MSSSTTLRARAPPANGSTAPPSIPNGQHANGHDAVSEKTKLAKTLWEKYEVPRKLLHSSIGVVVLFLNWVDPPSVTPIIQVLCVGLFFCVLADYIRFQSPSFAKTYEQYLGFLMRDSEKTKINGVIWYLVGVIFVLTFYPRDVAVLAIMILSWADTAASTWGRMFSSYRYNLRLPPYIGPLPLSSSKSLAGFIAAWITGFGVAVAYYGGGEGGGVSRNGAVDWRVLEWKRGVATTAMVVGGVAAVTEALDVGALDDNVTLPIVSGGLVWAWLSLSSRFL